MRLQVVKNAAGEDTGIFIPIEEWSRLKKDYPGIENSEVDIEQWEKELIDKRLDTISKHPEKIRSGKELLEELQQKR